MRILLDENIHPQVVALLRDAGHDVLSITETDKGASDPVVFQTAVSDERVLEIWPETPILPKSLFSWRRLPM
jgi:predicted nuclease of predicted toxin-antitoxin system